MLENIDSSKKLVSIVVPVFNSETTIEKLVHAVANLELEYDVEVVLINDGSADNSASICRKLVHEAGIPVTFVDLTKNFGEHNAVLAGLRHAAGKYIITMGDDLQNSPSDIPELLNVARKQEFDVVYTKFSEKHHSTGRNLGSWFANKTANLVLNKPKDLYLSSFRCINRTVVDQICAYTGPYPYVDGLIFQITDRCGSVEVEHMPRFENKSNYTLRRLIKLWSNILFNFSTIPLQLSLWLGVCMSGAASFGIIYVIIDVIIAGRTVPGWASNMIALLLIGGAQLTMLGVLGEYLGRTYILSGGRPQSVVREIVSKNDKAIL